MFITSILTMLPVIIAPSSNNRLMAESTIQLIQFQTSTPAASPTIIPNPSPSSSPSASIEPSPSVVPSPSPSVVPSPSPSPKPSPTPSLVPKASEPDKENPKPNQEATPVPFAATHQNPSPLPLPEISPVSLPVTEQIKEVIEAISHPSLDYFFKENPKNYYPSELITDESGSFIASLSGLLMLAGLAIIRKET